MQLQIKPKSSNILQPDGSSAKPREALDDLFVELGVAVPVIVAVGEDDSVVDGLALVVSKGDIICFLISIYYKLEISTVKDSPGQARA